MDGDAHEPSSNNSDRDAKDTEPQSRSPDDDSVVGEVKGAVRYYYRNLVVFCFTFFLVFFAFQPVQNLQSSVNASLGLISLTVLYVCFIISTIFSPFLIQVFGTKYVIVACYAAHCFYIVSNFYPEYYTLIPGSAVVGLASGPLWSSAGVYISSLADGVATVLNKDSDKYTGIFIGIMFWTLFASSWIGNGVSSAVLLADAGGLHFSAVNLTNSSNSSFEGATCSVASTADISPWAFYLLLSIFLAADLLGFFIALFGLSPTRKQAFAEVTCHQMAVDLKRCLRGFAKYLVTPRYLLMAPIVFYQGFNMGLVFGLFSKHFVTECVGVGFVGIAHIVLGLASSFSSVATGRIISKLPRSFVVIFGLVEDAAFILFLLFWERVPSFAAIVLVIFFWGIGDGIWNTLPTSYVGIITPKAKQDVAYSLQRFWMAIGFSAVFFMSNYLSVLVNLSTMLALLPFSVILYIIGDEMKTRSVYHFCKKLCTSTVPEDNAGVESSSALESSTSIASAIKDNSEAFAVSGSDEASTEDTARQGPELHLIVNPFFLRHRPSEVSNIFFSAADEQNTCMYP